MADAGSLALLPEEEVRHVQQQTTLYAGPTAAPAAGTLYITTRCASAPRRAPSLPAWS